MNCPLCGRNHSVLENCGNTESISCCALCKSTAHSSLDCPKLKGKDIDSLDKGVGDAYSLIQFLPNNHARMYDALSEKEQIRDPLTLFALAQEEDKPTHRHQPLEEIAQLSDGRYARLKTSVDLKTYLRTTPLSDLGVVPLLSPPRRVGGVHLVDPNVVRVGNYANVPLLANAFEAVDVAFPIGIQKNAVVFYSITG